MEIDVDLIAQLRKMALQGATAIEMVDMIHRTLGIAEYSRGIAFIYFREAFYIHIKDLSHLAGWECFGDGGGYNSKKVNDIMMPLIRQGMKGWS